MARILKNDEKREFAEAIREAEGEAVTNEEWFVKHLAEKRDVAMQMSAELGAWFALQPLPGRMPV